MINNVPTKEFPMASSTATSNRTISISSTLAPKHRPTLIMQTDRMKAIAGAAPNGRTQQWTSILPLYHGPKPTTTTTTTTTTKDMSSCGIGTAQRQLNTVERVRVQPIEPPTKLIKNRWNFGTLQRYNLNVNVNGDITGAVRAKNFKIINNNNNKTSNNNNHNTKEQQQQQVIATTASSAFSSNSCILQQQSDTATSAGTEADKHQIPHNNNNNTDRDNGHDKTTTTTTTVNRPTGLIHRTEDQENAFRRIEDVHNYAKINSYSYLNGQAAKQSNGDSSNSSLHYDDDDGEEEDGDDDESAGDDVDFVLDHADELDSRCEHYFRNRKRQASLKGGAKRKAAVDGVGAAKRSRSTSADDTDTHVDIETVHGDDMRLVSARADPTPMMAVPPEHHARRPMNAFLIFCKRHRAIVKDRYKSLENRAITKILGDWWASLDGNDKNCFTNLAQQNKDAFFSANPNFKWYKLPAPPLRNLSTRPGNGEVREPSEGGAYFKLADETQMGELNHLIHEPPHAQALQAALGETTQFLSAHMPVAAGAAKRRLAHDEKSFSSNSSEDDAVPKKSARSCKGKIYQELISSGQIAANSKKSKPGVKMSSSPHEHELEVKCSPGGGDVCNGSPALGAAMELMMPDGGTFDLEEKIKELPALDLDDYLQRKRTTKKKKKITVKKRSAAASPATKKGSAKSASLAEQALQQQQLQQQQRRQQQQQTVVGSQKRKARKESITRRDISAIDNEVASVLAPNDYTTITVCYYYEETGPQKTCHKSVATPMVGTPQESNANATNGQSIELCNSNNNNTNNNTSTSDLLILAEVAANHTEITN